MAIILAVGLEARLYPDMKSDVKKLNQKNWKSQVTNGNNNNLVFLVHFWRPNDGKSYEFSQQFIKEASKMKGIVYFGQINCEQN